MGWVQVKFRDPLPTDGPHYRPNSTQKLAGKPIRIWLPPISAEEGAKIIGATRGCDSELEWKLHPDDLFKLNPRLSQFNLYLACVHQLELD